MPLDAEASAFLVDQLGWFGRLALTPDDASDRGDRQTVLAPGQKLLFVFVGAFVLGGVGGLAGFVALVVLLVLALIRRLGSGVAASLTHHGLYAETFALWMLLFLGLQVVAGVMAQIGGPATELTWVVIAFFISLIALAWPVARGVPWHLVRQDVGLTFGSRPIVEPVIGVGGYFMALPMLALGIGLTLILLVVQEALSGPPPAFGPTGGPAHPVIEKLGGPDWWPKIQVLFLASVAAPIVEETMFRGVLYRHLRDATRSLGAAVSIVLSATIGSFVFAIIHPQGWVAVPALMS
ncbi:MAG: CPBP family glutamic-type intramembrane protease, partial [Planctomycetota bacterium]